MPLLRVPLQPGGAFPDVGVGASPGITTAANPPQTWHALIDTGSDVTTISPAIVAALQPTQIGQLPVTRPNGTTVYLPTYDVRIRLGGHTGPGQWISLEAVEVQPATTSVDVLIGIDLLIKIDMAWFGSRREVWLDV